MRPAENAAHSINYELAKELCGHSVHGLSYKYMLICKTEYSPVLCYKFYKAFY